MDTFFEIRGVNFDVESALSLSPLREGAKQWRRGETFGKSGKHVSKIQDFQSALVAVMIAS